MLTKKEQLKWNKPEKITKEDREYLDWFANQSIPCIVCGSYSNIEAHHLKKSSTDKKVHTQLLPLCQFHHTGNKISPHGAKKAFFNMFPIEAQREIATNIHNRYLGENNAI